MTASQPGTMIQSQKNIQLIYGTVFFVLLCTMYVLISELIGFLLFSLNN